MVEKVDGPENGFCQAERLEEKADRVGQRGGGGVEREKDGRDVERNARVGRRDRQTDRQTGRQTGRQTDRDRERQRDRDRETEEDRDRDTERGERWEKT